jgi:hypothetical protein
MSIDGRHAPAWWFDGLTMQSPMAKPFIDARYGQRAPMNDTAGGVPVFVKRPGWRLSSVTLTPLLPSEAAQAPPDGVENVKGRAPPDVLNDDVAVDDGARPRAIVGHDCSYEDERVAAFIFVVSGGAGEGPHLHHFSHGDSERSVMKRRTPERYGVGAWQHATRQTPDGEA